MIGADGRQLVAVARALREAKDKGLNKAMRQAVNAAVAPAQDAVRAGARSDLPSRGGLADRVASSKFRTQRQTGRNPGFTMIMRLPKKGGAVDLRAMNRGRIRHPVFGNRGTWVTQTVKAGWFEDALIPVKAKVAEDLVEAVRDMARQLAGSAQ